MPLKPIDFEKSFTGYLRLVPAGRKPPAPLTITQEEFVENMPATENDPGPAP
jgi:hypothetical protein